MLFIIIYARIIIKIGKTRSMYVLFQNNTTVCTRKKKRVEKGLKDQRLLTIYYLFKLGKIKKNIWIF